MKALLCSSFLLFFAVTTDACANFTGSGTAFNGGWVRGASPFRLMELRRALRRDLQQDGAKLEAQLRGSTNYNDRSDYSIALMYLGRSKEAVELLQQLENEQPGNYFIAANLGTAHELAGNNKEAARWIAEGIQRNPGSHEGTEWLHLKILQAKISQEGDPDYFKRHSVLDLHPENLGASIAIGEQTLSSAQLEEAIQHQLAERLQFVKPPDAAVASLLFDYAAVEAVSRTLESAKTVLAFAVEYGYPSDQVKPLIATYDHRIAWRKFKEYSAYCLMAIGVVALFVYLYKKKIFVLSRRDLLGRA